MLAAETVEIIEAARADGWVLEPQALRVLAAAGVPVPRFAYARSAADAQAAAARIGFPVVAKVVSPQIMHKSEVRGVRPGLADAGALAEAYDDLSRLPGFAGVLLAEMLSGQELIVGAKIDFQFGPVILLGIGGTAVEIYKDTVTRMAPLRAPDVRSMLACLQGSRLLTGHRGGPGIDMARLTAMVLSFSDLVMDLGDRAESIDLNPVFCSSERCVAADARILLPPRA
ncbi:MAG: acetate--CoA ligase family protein [Desulfobacterales bacterium]